VGVGGRGEGGEASTPGRGSVDVLALILASRALATLVPPKRERGSTRAGRGRRCLEVVVATTVSGSEHQRERQG